MLILRQSIRYDSSGHRLGRKTPGRNDGKIVLIAPGQSKDQYDLPCLDVMVMAGSSDAVTIALHVPDMDHIRSKGYHAAVTRLTERTLHPITHGGQPWEIPTQQLYAAVGRQDPFAQSGPIRLCFSRFLQTPAHYRPGHYDEFRIGYDADPRKVQFMTLRYDFETHGVAKKA